MPFAIELKLSVLLFRKETEKRLVEVEVTEPVEDFRSRIKHPRDEPARDKAASQQYQD